MINTVLGEIDASDMGRTLMHEHAVCFDVSLRNAFGKKWVDEEKAVEFIAKRLKAAKENSGIQTIVDATPINSGRDVRILKQASLLSGVNILAATGLFAFENFPIVGKSAEFFVELLMGEIFGGIEDTGIKPAVVKCATGPQGFTEINQKLLWIAGEVCKRTGIPITTHTETIDMAVEQQNFFDKNGVDLSKVIIGHTGDYNDIEKLSEIVKKGSYLGLDRFGLDEFNSLENRVNTLDQLFQKGFADSLVVSHDIVLVFDADYDDFSDFPQKAENGRTFDYFCEVVVPRLKERGYHDEDIQRLLVDNPRRFFEG
ncbi:phosphotriesterase [Blautia sp. 1033sp1_1033st1_G9_1033SCRN_220408]|uniref:phosphotriesterase n=1 Tax=Blautia sp. 1033sp1_1033st1_G9_1033SCRN_220408 TaxID=3144490 RepID=UPI0034A25E06